MKQLRQSYVEVTLGKDSTSQRDIETHLDSSQVIHMLLLWLTVSALPHTNVLPVTSVSLSS